MNPLIWTRASKVLPALWHVLLAVSLLFGIDILFVLLGSGISIEIAGYHIRSTTIDFPAIGVLVTGLAALLIAGQWREASLLFGALTIAGLMVELSLRIVDHPLSKDHVDYAIWYKPSDYYGHELVPGFEGFGPLDIPVKINRDGFRDGYHAREKPPGVLRVLGLGDSFVFGWGVQEEEAFLKRLEVGLEDRIKQPVETINAGVPGWGLNQYYLFLKRTGIQFSPDIVVVAYFVDDLSGPVQDHIPPATQYDGRLQFKGSILHHSKLFNFLKSLSHLVREKNRSTRVGYLHDLEERRTEFSKRTVHLISESAPGMTEDYSHMLIEHLQRLRTLVDAAKAGMVVMLVPDISQLHHPESQLINRILLKLCRDLSIPFVDMTPVFERSTDPARYYLWPKDPHTNSAGHAEMAVAVERLVCEMPKLRPVCENAGESMPMDQVSIRWSRREASAGGSP